MVCRTFGIHPKSIYKKPKTQKGGTVLKFYNKKEDSEILSQIKGIINIRPTYGYKRVTAMVNSKRNAISLGKINKKRVFRVMKKNGLMLPKTEKIRTHKPTGKVMTLHPNTRWCSDCFEIKCFNGEKVFVSFSLDTCDREAISFVAKDRPILAEDIQALMLDSVEKRFSNTRTSRQIEWLTDRGSIYRAYNVQALGRELNLKCCYTASYSPESNGMAEAFVGTIKRDYVYVSDCYSAKDWFKDYNEVAPHSALGMKSPAEYKQILVNKR
jgi:putative transposase